MFLTKLIRTMANVICQCYVDYRAYVRKQRSLHDLQRLDDYLLDDIGMVRGQDGIVPLKHAADQQDTVRQQCSKTRLRHARLIRRRRYLRNSGNLT